MDALLNEAWKLTGPWVLYDGNCPLCRRGEKLFGAMLRRRGFRLATLQSAAGCYFSNGREDEMKVVTREAKVIGGAEGLAYISGFVWWAVPLEWCWRIKALRPLLEWGYRWVAAHRKCEGPCRIQQQV